MPLTAIRMRPDLPASHFCLYVEFTATFPLCGDETALKRRLDPQSSPQAEIIANFNLLCGIGSDVTTAFLLDSPLKGQYALKASTCYHPLQNPPRHALMTAIDNESERAWIPQHYLISRPNPRA
jgi:hypothetical protein